ncbi:thiamine-phosphate kinase [Paenibacillus sp. y28]|uniref:thiamine-phosphate kinase n=1 Tax=Paenibacillus sp. y28 TaxID=3129110 RepID=UPI0030167AAF
MDEFALIRRLTAQSGTIEKPERGTADSAAGAMAASDSGVTVGIGDDAAVVRHRSGWELVLSCDAMVETVHFRPDTMRAADVGFKAMASNISDMAAMGAVPRYALVTLCKPPHIPVAWLEALYNGLYECASRYGVAIVGGDTTSTPGSFVVSVTVTGEVEAGRALLRSGAQPGQAVFTTGYLGCSAAGLHGLLKQGRILEPELWPATGEEAAGSKGLSQEEALVDPIGGAGPEPGEAPAPALHELIREHQRPLPQVEAGRLLAQSGLCGALNDISDGLASEAWEIAEASGIGLVLEEASLPVHPGLAAYALQAGLDPLDWILYGGEDYQLVGTVLQEHADKLRELFEAAGLPFHLIGRTVEGPAALTLIRSDGRRQNVPKRGYNHFAGPAEVYRPASRGESE